MAGRCLCCDSFLQEIAHISHQEVFHTWKKIDLIDWELILGVAVTQTSFCDIYVNVYISSKLHEYVSIAEVTDKMFCISIVAG